MSTVKANNFSPATLPIVEIDGFNEVESFVVGASQTSFTSSKFTNRSPIRAFKENDVTAGQWDELTVNWTNTTDFTIAESYSEGDEILMYGIGQYYQGETDIGSDEVLNESGNSEFSGSTTLTDILDLFGAAAKLESYKDYGVGDTSLQSVSLAQAENIAENGLYYLNDTGYDGHLLCLAQGGNKRQVYFPFGENTMMIRHNQGGSFEPFSYVYSPTTIDSSETASFTLALDQAYSYIRVNSGVAATVTVPTNASVEFPIGTNITLCQAGAGQLTTSPAGGVTVNSADSLLSTRAQFSSIMLVKVGTDEWDLVGDLA